MSPKIPQVSTANCNAIGVSAVFPGNIWAGITADAAGNITTDNGSTMTWDVEGRMVSAPQSGTTYDYDGEGRRVRKTTGNVATRFIYDAFGKLAMDDGGPSETTNLQYTHQDHLGSTRLLTDNSGAVTRRYDYRPFGATLTSVDTSWRSTALSYDGVGVALKFTGKERDAETGLDYFGARYMSSAQGRFTSPDPVGGHLENPQTLNKYTYVANNPLRFVDPTGLDFYLTCEERSDSCRGGHAGTTTVDGKGKEHFTATVISNGKDGGLVDQNGNQYSGNFDQSGFHFSDSQGNSYGGAFVSNSAATTLSGAGTFAGFTGVFNSNGVNTNVAQGSLFGPASLFDKLIKSGNLVGPNPGLDGLNRFHVGTNYRGGNDTGADPHLTVRSPYNFDPRTGLNFGDFHYDGAYSFGDVVGFVEHTSAVLKFTLNTKILRQKEVPPPITIPR